MQGLIDAAAAMLTREGARLIDYPTPGDHHRAMRRVASERFAFREGTRLPEDRIVVTAGSGDAINELAGYLAAPGDTIITEQLTYMGSINQFRAKRLQMIGIPVEPTDGMDMQVLETTLDTLSRQGRTPKFIYTIATYQNPTGAILPSSARKRLLEVAAHYAVPIIEDDCYGDVHLSSEPPPPSLYRLAEGRGVIYVGSLSKIMGPGLRLGYMCVPPEMQDITEQRVSDRASGLASMIVAEYLQHHLVEHLARHVEVLSGKRDVIMASLDDQLAGVCTWNRPRGGLFCWLRLPDGVATAQLEQRAASREVEYAPGRLFHVENTDVPFIRLSYTHMSETEIREGVQRLAACIREAAD